MGSFGGPWGSDPVVPPRYEPERDEWALVAPMGTRRIGVGVAVLNRLLYAVGGFDGSARLRSAERYHPERDSWQPIPPMATVRSGAGGAGGGQGLPEGLWGGLRGVFGGG